MYHREERMFRVALRNVKTSALHRFLEYSRLKIKASWQFFKKNSKMPNGGGGRKARYVMFLESSLLCYGCGVRYEGKEGWGEKIRLSMIRIL